MGIFEIYPIIMGIIYLTGVVLVFYALILSIQALKKYLREDPPENEKTSKVSKASEV